MNVVRLFHQAIELAIKHKTTGKSDIDKELEDLLKDDEFWDGEEVQVWYDYLWPSSKLFKSDNNIWNK